MARSARIILPNVPHHVTQRGNRRQTTFFCSEDYLYYLELMHLWLPKFSVALNAYCLMPNHTHLVVTPHDKTGIARSLEEIHKRYTRMVNFRNNWRGHLWQGRYYSVPLKDNHYENALRYTELNPVRANLCKNPVDYPWSSAKNAGRGIQFYNEFIDLDLMRKMTRRGKEIESIQSIKK